MSNPEKDTAQSENRRKLEEFNSNGRRARRGKKDQSSDSDKRKDPKSWRARWEEAKKLAENAEKHSTKKPDGKDDKKKRPFRSIVSYIAVVLLIGTGIFWFFAPGGFSPIKTSEGIQILEKSEIVKERIQVTDGSQVVQVWLAKEFTPHDLEGKKGSPTKKVQFQFVSAQADKVEDLVSHAKAKNGYNSVVPQQSFLGSLLTLVLPLLILFGLLMWMLPKIQQGSMGAFGRVKKDGLEEDRPDVTFADVAGADEAVEELQEIEEFIDHPDKFRKMGAKIPRGVLLYGPPGTGKTLLAKAVAGEAGVPFFHISASEFVEMFVGVGASRVRDLFTKAKKLAPAIIFVDEIDAVGRNRGQGMGGGNDEREQTLNQLLVEMDGFDERANVIVIAATNRPDVLDPALLRPGRFDRQIAVDAPDLKGRSAILKVHAEGKPLADGIELESIARRTPGFAGAELANLLNEAALLATRREHEAIQEDDLDEAIDRVIAGPQRRTHVMNADEKRMTAYHEGGHAVAAAALNHTDPVTKVTILPRGRALGYTMVMPTEDKYSVSRNELLDQLVYAMGGRVAEEIVFHDPSTGASNDIQKATDIARKMVMEYGMSAKVGSVRLVPDESDPMTRLGGGGQREYSDDLARVIDDEVHQLLETAHQEAWTLMMENRHVLDALAAALLEKETILEKELAEIFTKIVKTPARQQWLSSPNRPVSDLPPVPLPVVAPNEAQASDDASESNGTSAEHDAPAGENHE
ncbi:ATP-dependent zinc metalloprotease FtsH [Arcanobacterium phocae]|uniref:ATP-dependent zinc metalloprotease FtsH n=1 Tax=Arcanobacterium phocae TaxID=131112 RepID=A0A1H2LA87_9ACTO|nr:ATP-dependent zinc metalloprotease FtsH [Arcanobacterium phocae]SDU77829.1 membrane protease FtsH catalytic subunit [Arcanobacterium phocae]